MFGLKIASVSDASVCYTYIIICIREDLILLKKILLSGYFIIISCIGILFVPVSLKWGPQLEFYDKRYVPLWQLQSKEFQVDDYYPIYELDILRIVYEIGIVTLLLFIIYLILKEVFKSK